MFFEHSLCILGSQISRYWTSNFRQIGENWERMVTPEEIQELKGEIRTKGVYIEELKTLWKETKDKDDKKYFGDQISAETGLLTAKENRLTALITSQQGNFSSRSSVVLSQSSRCNPLPKSLSTLHLHTFRFGKY